MSIHQNSEILVRGKPAQQRIPTTEVESKANEFGVSS
tara:strand:- start:458 stop:568 length:111 start_codon:yes stop_codon:yes gene_type:complete